MKIKQLPILLLFAANIGMLPKAFSQEPVTPDTLLTLDPAAAQTAQDTMKFEKTELIGPKDKAVDFYHKHWNTSADLYTIEEIYEEVNYTTPDGVNGLRIVIVPDSTGQRTFISGFSKDNNFGTVELEDPINLQELEENIKTDGSDELVPFINTIHTSAQNSFYNVAKNYTDLIRSKKKKEDPEFIKFKKEMIDETGYALIKSVAKDAGLLLPPDVDQFTDIVLEKDYLTKMSEVKDDPVIGSVILYESFDGKPKYAVYGGRNEEGELSFIGASSSSGEIRNFVKLKSDEDAFKANAYVVDVLPVSASGVGRTYFNQGWFDNLPTSPTLNKSDLFEENEEEIIIPIEPKPPHTQPRTEPPKKEQGHLGGGPGGG
jgi:hypothetical protein